MAVLGSVFLSLASAGLAAAPTSAALADATANALGWTLGLAMVAVTVSALAGLVLVRA
nr:hypothetical protein [Chloroflexota bacterium]